MNVNDLVDKKNLLLLNHIFKRSNSFIRTETITPDCLELEKTVASKGIAGNQKTGSTFNVFTATQQLKIFHKSYRLEAFDVFKKRFPSLTKRCSISEKIL